MLKTHFVFEMILLTVLHETRKVGLFTKWFVVVGLSRSIFFQRTRARNIVAECLWFFLGNGGDLTC
jgi:hypothetical protein